MNKRMRGQVDSEWMSQQMVWWGIEYMWIGEWLVS